MSSERFFTEEEFNEELALGANVDTLKEFEKMGLLNTKASAGVSKTFVEAYYHYF